MVRRKVQDISPEQFVTNLEEAKQVQRHNLLLRIINLLAYTLTFSFVGYVGFSVFMGFKNNQGPGFDTVSSVFGSISQVLGTAIGAN